MVKTVWLGEALQNGGCCRQIYHDTKSSLPVSLQRLLANLLGGPTGTTVTDLRAAVIFLSCKGSPGQVTSLCQVTSLSPPELLQVAPNVGLLETRFSRWNLWAANFRPEHSAVSGSVCVCVSVYVCESRATWGLQNNPTPCPQLYPSYFTLFFLSLCLRLKEQQQQQLSLTHTFHTHTHTHTVCV